MIHPFCSYKKQNWKKNQNFYDYGFLESEAGEIKLLKSDIFEQRQNA